ncbi:hypothetical protein TNCV_3827331 [Trichonephila clavipes]|nr:hypothetical protein TNCV_3827331 [Trichonephila clavipes]
MYKVQKTPAGLDSPTVSLEEFVPKSWSLLSKNSSNQFARFSLESNFSSLRKFKIREKDGNRLVPGPDYMADALKLPNRAPRVSGESLQAWRCPNGTQHFFCWPILTVSSQSLASNGPVVDSRYLKLVFDHTEETHNK